MANSLVYLGRVFEGVLKQDGYKAELFQSLEEVKKRAQAVKDEALQCQAQMISMMSDSAEENARLTNARLNEIYDFLCQSTFTDAKKSGNNPPQVCPFSRSRHLLPKGFTCI